MRADGQPTAGVQLQHMPAQQWLGMCARCPHGYVCVVQIGYSTVFFFEYLGPMLIYPMFFLFPQIFYGK